MIPRVLIIDDEPLLAESLAGTLGDFEVISTTSGKAALECLQHERFDAILCDVVMPAPSGIELFRAAQSAGAGLERRFVFMTGDASSPVASGFLAQVPNPILEKPFTREALIDAIARVARVPSPDLPATGLT